MERKDDSGGGGGVVFRSLDLAKDRCGGTQELPYLRVLLSRAKVVSVGC